MPRRKLYRNFRDRSGDTTHRIPVIAAAFVQKYKVNLLHATSLKWSAKHHLPDCERAVQRVLMDLRPSARCDKYLSHAVARWLADRSASGATRCGYLSALRRWIIVTGLRRLDWQCEVRPRFLADYRDHLVEAMGSPRTVNRHLTMLRSWYGWLKSIGLVAVSPVVEDLFVPVDRENLYHPRRLGHIRRRLTSVQASALLAWLMKQNPAVHLGVALAIDCGLRRSEITGLQRSDLITEGAERVITLIGKGRRRRSCVLGQMVSNALDRYLESHITRGRPRTIGPLLVNRHGAAWHPSAIGRWVTKAGIAIDRPDLTPHELRRTCATLMRDQGATLEQAQAQMGHASPVLTQEIYDVGDRRWRGGTGIAL